MDEIKRKWEPFKEALTEISRSRSNRTGLDYELSWTLGLQSILNMEMAKKLKAPMILLRQWEPAKNEPAPPLRQKELGKNETAPLLLVVMDFDIITKIRLNRPCYSSLSHV